MFPENNKLTIIEVRGRWHPENVLRSRRLLHKSQAYLDDEVSLRIKRLTGILPTIFTLLGSGLLSMAWAVA